MVSRILLGVSRSNAIKKLVTSAPITRDVVGRYVAGETAPEALAVTARLTGAGLKVTVDHLGEDTLDRSQADAVTEAYVGLLRRLSEADLASDCEVSVKLTALGLLLGGDGPTIARANAELICAAARAAGTTVTVDMEDHTTTDATLKVVRALRQEFPDVGAVLQAYLFRTEADCRELAAAGSRVRLCKGAYDEPAEVAYTDNDQVDRSYVRCLKILINGAGYPMIATHDPRLIEIAQMLINRAGRAPDSYEFQMLYGIRPNEQQRLANAGHIVRIYVPYGTDWYGYLVRRLAEKPANLAFFARSLVSRG